MLTLCSIKWLKLHKGISAYNLVAQSSNENGISRTKLGSGSKGNNNSQFEEDELLARAIQECLNEESPPIYDNGNKYQPVPVYYSMGYKICAGYQTEIGFGRYLNCLNGFWHPKCFRYQACNLTITDYEVLFLNYKIKSKWHHSNLDKKNYFYFYFHHYISIANPRATNAHGGIPFGSRNICPFHKHDGTPRYCSSERIEPRDTRYVSLNDGQKLCLECLDSVIMDTTECQPLFLDIQEFYEGLNMKLEQQVLLLLVERLALNEAREGERNGHYHMPETRGLCLSEEQTISTISRCPRFGVGNRATYMKIEPYKLTCHCEVTAILILYGLPRLLITWAVLALDLTTSMLRITVVMTTILKSTLLEKMLKYGTQRWMRLTKPRPLLSSALASLIISY
ncbi:hypothetical protein UlMin_023835 [Ulmus minor]